MWTCENRAKYNRDKLHYPSDLTDEEWSHVAPLIPPAKHGGRKRKVDVREVVNGIMYVRKIKGNKRHILVDTVGLLLHAVVHPADIQDRETVAFWFSRLCPVLTRSYANCSPMAAIKDRNFAKLRRKPCRTLRHRS
jgi:Putative transposase of IS4/5 family (DUF4096)